MQWFQEDEATEADTTAWQVAAELRDPQGIPWELTPYSREDYRAVRLEQYSNYYNREYVVAAGRPRLLREATRCVPGARLFAFAANRRAVRPTIVHFQLRNLLSTPDASGLYVVQDGRVIWYDASGPHHADVLDGRRGLEGASSARISDRLCGPVQLSTLAVGHGVVASGGFMGELLVAREDPDEARARSAAAAEAEADRRAREGAEDWEDPFPDADGSLEAGERARSSRSASTSKRLGGADDVCGEGEDTNPWCWPRSRRRSAWRSASGAAAALTRDSIGPLEWCADRDGWGLEGRAWDRPPAHLPELKPQRRGLEVVGGWPVASSRGGVAGGAASLGAADAPAATSSRSRRSRGLRARHEPPPPPLACARRIASSENGITNALEISLGASGAPRIVAANNDEAVRVLDAETCRVLRSCPLPWAVNGATARPGGSGKLLLAVGDDPAAALFDADEPGGSARPLARLEGHLDYSFAAAWHPGGTLLATGNQDCTARVYDIRRPDRTLALLPANAGAVRSLRFSPCGRFLASGEPADYVTLYDVTSGFSRCQVIDLFGEIAGTAFTPDSSRFTIGVADVNYGSAVQFDRATAAPLWDDLF